MTKLVAGMCPAMTAQVLKLLHLKGITDVVDFVSMDPEKITSTCGISYKKVLSIRRLLLAEYSSFPINGLALYKEILSSSAVLSTGCSNLDDILDGGIYTREVTEVVGVSVSGKSQFCQTLAVNVAAAFEQNVICIDTSLGWSSSRMNEIAAAKCAEVATTLVLSRVRLAQCLAMNDLLGLMDQICKSLQSPMDPFYFSVKLIILDSVAALLSPCFFQGTYIEGLSMLQKFGRRLNALAKEFNVAVVITNNMVSGNSGSGPDSFFLKPALGRCWTFVPSVRLIFEPESEPCCLHSNQSASTGVYMRAILNKSSRSGRKTSRFQVTQAGIQNAT